MSYTEEETTTAVQTLVKGSLSFPQDKLGPRDVNTPFSEAVELIHSVLLYEPDAIFFIIYLAKNNARAALSATINSADDLIDAIDDLLKPFVPIKDVTGLGDAAAALNSMEGALARKGALGSREYRRYDSATNRVNDEIGRSVKLTHIPTGSSTVTTEIVRPPEEAKQDAASEFNSLESLHEEVLSSVDQLLLSYSEFQEANLAESVASFQLSRASSKMSELDEEMSALSAEERISRARQVLLDVMANRAVVRSLAERVDPGAPKLVQSSTGVSLYRMTAYGSGTAPTIIGSISAPWAIESGVNDELEFDLNGSTLSAINLLPSGDSYNQGIRAAEIVGSNAGPFRVGAALSTPYPFRTREISTGTNYSVNGKTIYLVVDGTSLKYDFTADRNATSVASDLSTAFSGYASATAYINVSGNDYVHIEWNNTTDAPNLYGSRYMLIGSGTNTATNLAHTPASNSWEVIGPTNEITNETRGWSGTDSLKIQPNDSSNGTTLSLTGGDWPDYTRTATQVAADIDSGGSTHFDCAADVTDDTIVITSKWKGEGSILRILTDGLHSVSDNTALELGFSKDQESRESDVGGRTVQNILNNNSDFKEDAKASLVRTNLLESQSATVTGASEITFPTTLDSDPSSSWQFSQSTKLEISNGDNRGTYIVTGTSWNGTTGDIAITLSRGLRDVDSTHLHTARVYTEFLRIASLDASIAGEIDINEINAFSAHSAIGLATEATLATVATILVEYNDPLLGWLPFDLRQNRIRVGDLVEGYLTNIEATVTDISEASDGILGVTNVTANFSLSAFTVISAAYRAFETFIDSLQDWRDNVTYESLRKIDKSLSPLLLLREPTKARVNAAISLVSDLKSELESLGTIYDAFSINTIVQVNNAIAALQEKGYNRSHDLLVEGNIEEFFSMTAKTASYSSAMLKAAADVAVQDVNEPTKRRTDNEFGDEIDRVATEFHAEDVDPNWDFSDEEVELPELAVDYFDSRE